MLGDCSHGWVAREHTLRRLAHAPLLPRHFILCPLKSLAWTWWMRTGRWLSGEDEGCSTQWSQGTCRADLWAGLGSEEDKTKGSPAHQTPLSL